MSVTTLMPSDRVMYRALVRRDESYEGVFIVGVKTTGIFCRPTCSARKPHEKNVEFFRSPKDALLSGYRPCRRCRPLEQKGESPAWIRPLLSTVDSSVEERIRDTDLRSMGLEPARVRRWFREHLGMTFQGYQRSLRLGKAMGQLKLGEDLTQVAFGHGYESVSGFRDAFQAMFGTTPGNGRGTKVLTVNRILTPLGPMLAGTTDDGICLLEFVDRRMIETQLRVLQKRLGASFVPGEHDLLHRLDGQMHEYFSGARTTFDVPLTLGGTPFQVKAWNALLAIPYGSTRSYEEQARAIGAPSAVRAVANANGQNRIAVVIPCHRVIGADGELRGYGGGLWRKRLLLELEKKTLNGTRG